MSQVDGLIRYLREHPAELERSPQDLADRFGLDAEFVRSVQAGFLGNARQQRTAADRATANARALPDLVQTILRGIGDFWMRITAQPEIFVGCVTLLHIIATYFVRRFLPAPTAQSSSLDPSQVVALGMVLGLLTLQFACYARHGRSRHVLYGAFITFGLLAIEAIASSLLLGESLGQQMFSASVFAIFVAVIGTPFAIAGGYLQVRVRMRERNRMTRQELLERLFKLRERLQRASEQRVTGTGIGHHPWVIAFRKRDLLYSLAIGVVFGVMFVLVFGTLDPTGESLNDPTAMAPAVLLATFLTSMLNMVITIALGFLIGRPMRALGVGLAYLAGSVSMSLIPYGPFGLEYLKEFPIGNWIGSVLVMGVLLVAGGIGATIEEQAAKERRIREDDPAALLNEIFELESILRPTARRVTVMVVDVAGSSRMKASADPFDAEWSFREYQQLIARVSGEFLGEVHSIAGDGAVVGFAESDKALGAAWAIQEEIREFNNSVSRLREPFRLRIGLHSGEIAGNLDAVQFTAVIDIAAHVEAACPVGQVAVSGKVAAELHDRVFEPLGQSVDGEDLFVARKILALESGGPALPPHGAE